MSAARTAVLWFPDWPISTHQRSFSIDQHTPTALLRQRLVFACCPVARAAGVRVGMRERDAQAICPDLVLIPHDPALDHALFEPVTAALDEVVAGVALQRPGLCSVRVRGPARYYGSEEAAAEVLQERARTIAPTEVTVGIADGIFAAEQAARMKSSAQPNTPHDPEAAPVSHLRTPRAGIHIVPPSGSAAFLAPLPVSRAADERLSGTLHRLGIATLGALAALPAEAVAQRFGPAGRAAHHRALGHDPATPDTSSPLPPPLDRFVRTAVFDPPIHTDGPLTAASHDLAQRILEAVTGAGLICSGLTVSLTDDAGTRHERSWSHPTRFTDADIVDRIRWQAESMDAGARRSSTGGSGTGGSGTGGSGDIRSGLIEVRVEATRTDRAAHHEPGLWSSAPDERVQQGIRRIQDRTGQAAVGLVGLQGGRLLADRQCFTAWGAADDSLRGSNLPWPGSLDGALPSVVFHDTVPVDLHDAAGSPVGIIGGERLTRPPATLIVPGAAGSPYRVTAWSAPWVLRERWWERVPTRVRLQLLLDTGEAWLLLHETAQWRAEGRYD